MRRQKIDKAVRIICNISLWCGAAALVACIVLLLLGKNGVWCDRLLLCMWLMFVIDLALPRIVQRIRGGDAPESGEDDPPAPPGE